MKMIFLLLAINSFLLLGCTKEKKECCAVISLGLNFNILNDKGIDLLNPTSSNFYSQEKIDLFYKNDNGFEKLSKPNQDNPKNIKIYKNSNNIYVLQLDANPNIIGNDSLSVTLLKIGNFPVDTIKAKLIKKDGSMVVKAAWVNGNNIPLNEPYILRKN